MRAVGDYYLEIRDLKVGFETFDGFVEALDVGELCIGHGESYGLVGESGAGKTVLALALLGLLRRPPAVVKAGKLSLDGEALLEKSAKELRALRGRKISMIFQDPMSALDPVRTVGSQLTDVVRLGEKMSRKAAAERARKLMQLVELPDPETMMLKYPHQLSGGQRQRVIIALALACGSGFLIADEPTRNLDVTVQASILKTVYRLRRELDVSVLFIANNLALVSAMCDRVGILLKGRIVETGTVRDVVRSPLHPYTLDLLRSVPRRNERSLAGRVFGEFERTVSACWHYQRCDAHGPACEGNEAPSLRPVSETHAVACVMATAEPTAAGTDSALTVNASVTGDN